MRELVPAAGLCGMHLKLLGGLVVPAAAAHPAIQMIGPRLVARQYCLADACAIWGAIDESRASLARWVPDIARRHTPADVRAGLEHLAAESERGQRLVYGLWQRATGHFVGEVGLYELNWDRRSAEVGYWLRETARGRGYAAAALDLMSAQAHRGFGLEQLEAHISPDNDASRRVAERQGFRIIGQRPAVAEWDGGAPFVLIYARALESKQT